MYLIERTNKDFETVYVNSKVGKNPEKTMHMVKVIP